MDTGRIRLDEVAEAITAVGGVDAVHRSWREDRDQAIYGFLPAATAGH